MARKNHTECSNNNNVAPGEQETHAGRTVKHTHRRRAASTMDVIELCGKRDIREIVVFIALDQLVIVLVLYSRRTG
jgi:hypothetical protein